MILRVLHLFESFEAVAIVASNNRSKVVLQPKLDTNPLPRLVVHVHMSRPFLVPLQNYI